MHGMIAIDLKGLQFYAYHGLYEEEKKAGNEFLVNLSVFFRPVSGTISGLSDTVNYASLYALLKKEMAKPRHLLETLVMEVAEAIHLTFPFVSKIEIDITKLHVPIVQFTGTAGVKYTAEF